MRPTYGYGYGVDRKRQISAAAQNLPTLEDIFGDDMLLDLDPWDRPDLTVESGGYVSAVQSVVGGVTYSQAIGSAMPASVNGAKHTPKGDGIDDELSADNLAWIPSGISFSCGGFGYCDLDPLTDTTAHTLFALGSAGTAKFAVERRTFPARPGINHCNVFVFDGTNVQQVGNASDNNIVGGFHWWFEYNITTGATTFYVNGTLVNTLTLAGVLIDGTRSRLFANTGGSAGLFGKLTLGQLVITKLATTEQREAAMAVLAAKAAAIAA